MAYVKSKSPTSIKRLSLSAILAAFAILIPLMMPVKVVIGPASYTLASHVPLFIAMFISPLVGILVALGSSLGFFLAGFPPVIVFRALTHLGFISIGALVLKRFPRLLESNGLWWFAIGINLLHGLGEYLVVMLLTTTGEVASSYWLTMLALVGLGTVLHGLVDFALAYYLRKVLASRKINII